MTTHEVERKVMKCPPHDQESNHLIILDDSRAVEILVSTLLTKDEEGADDEVDCDAGGTHPPGERITDEIDVAVVLNPEVDPATEGRPVPRTRVVCVTAGETCVGPPHHFLELPPFTDETRELVVDLFSIGGD